MISCNKRRITYPCEANYSSVDTIFYDYRNGNIISRDSVFGKISLVSLETNNDNLIGTVDQIILGDSTIIIADRRIAKAVFMFDYDGKYIGRISNLGNGRNEYLDLTHVCKRKDKSIALLDEISGIVLVYDERGNYIETIKTDLYANAMEFITDELMAFDIYSRYPKSYDPYGDVSFTIRNKNQEIKYLFGLTHFKHGFNYSRYYNLYSYDNVVYCNVNFEDYIYELTSDSVKAKYRIIYGPENVNNYPYKNKEELYSLQDSYPFFEGEFVELSDYTYIMYRGLNGNELFYNHNTKQTVAISSGFNNPLLAFFRRPIARYGENTLVCSLSVTDMLTCRKMLLEGSIQNTEVMDLYQRLELDSNPTLFFFEVSF